MLGLFSDAFLFRLRQRLLGTPKFFLGHIAMIFAGKHQVAGTGITEQRRIGLFQLCFDVSSWFRNASSVCCVTRIRDSRFSLMYSSAQTFE